MFVSSLEDSIFSLIFVIWSIDHAVGISFHTLSPISGLERDTSLYDIIYESRSSILYPPLPACKSLQNKLVIDSLKQS